MSGFDPFGLPPPFGPLQMPGTLNTITGTVMPRLLEPRQCPWLVSVTITPSWDGYTIRTPQGYALPRYLIVDPFKLGVGGGW